MYNLTQMPGGGDGTALSLSAKVEGAEDAMNDLSRLGYAYTSYELISSRVAAAEVQVERADIAVQNITLQMIDTHMKLASEEQKLTQISTNYQLSLERRAGLVKEVENAERTGTGTSNQYAMAQVMLQQANADVMTGQIRMADQNRAVATTYNQLQIESNNLAVQQKILALDQQRVNELSIVKNLYFLQMIGSMTNLIPLIIKGAEAMVALATSEAAADIASIVGMGAGIAALGVLGYTMYQQSTAPRAQYGGIVTSPTMMMVGEAGPEQISPIGSNGGSVGAIVNVSIGIRMIV